MTRRLTDDQINELADHLQGSCTSLGAALEQLFDLSEDALHITDNYALDDKVFCCVGCDWWFEIGDMTNDESNDWHCTECAPNI